MNTLISQIHKIRKIRKDFLHENICCSTVLKIICPSPLHDQILAWIVIGNHCLLIQAGLIRLQNTTSPPSPLSLPPPSPFFSPLLHYQLARRVIGNHCFLIQGGLIRLQEPKNNQSMNLRPPLGVLFTLLTDSGCLQFDIGSWKDGITSIHSKCSLCPCKPVKMQFRKFHFQI